MDENKKTVTEQLNEIREVKNTEQAKALAREYYAQALENSDVSWRDLNGVGYLNLKSTATGWPIVDNPNATMNGIWLAAKDVGNSAIEPVTNTGEWLLKRAIDEVKFIQAPISSLKESADKVIDATVGNHMAERQALAAVMRIDDEDARITELTRAEWRPIIGWGLAVTGPRIALDTPAATAVALSATEKTLNNIAVTGTEDLMPANGAPFGQRENLSKSNNVPISGALYSKGHAVDANEPFDFDNPKYANNPKDWEVPERVQATQEQLRSVRQGNGRNDLVPGENESGFIDKMGNHNIGDNPYNGVKVVRFLNGDVKLYRHVDTEITKISAQEALGVFTDNPQARKNLILDIKEKGGIKQIEQVLATENFLVESVARTEKQLVEGMVEYARTARTAQTYGDTLNRYPGHEDALVRYEIASVKLDALKYGKDASINNTVIADLTRNGSASKYFYAEDVMKEVKKYDPRRPLNPQEAADIAFDATKLAHVERRNFLLETEKLRALSPPEMLELGVGDNYGVDAAAHASDLIKNGGLAKVDQLYPSISKNVVEENLVNQGKNSNDVEKRAGQDRRNNKETNSSYIDDGEPRQNVRRNFHAKEIPEDLGNLKINVSENPNPEPEAMQDRRSLNQGRRASDNVNQQGTDITAENKPLSLKDAIQHLDDPKAQEVVLARINEQNMASKLRSMGTEHV